MSTPSDRTVLVVEDDHDVRESLQQVLEMEGYRVTTAKNGRDALETLAASSPPRLILLDMLMPEMNGWQFLAARRTNPALSTIPVVVISATGECSSGPAGATDFLRKPIDIDGLLQVVAKHCT